MKSGLLGVGFLRRVGAECVLAVGVVASLAPATPAVAAELGSAQLLIAGTRLAVSPESQTVPYNTPTIVETHLEGFDASLGSLPGDLRVLADFTGPEIHGILTLETVPNEPFRIPRPAGVEPSL